MNNEICKTNLTNIIEQISEKVSEYLDTKDIILDNDYIEILGDSFKIVGILQKSAKLISQKKFEDFLRGFRDNEHPTEEQLTKLLNYINSEQKAEFIADTFSKILLSQSRKACLIMGYIMRRMVDNKSTLSHYEIICIDTLPKLFDIDILNFNFFCKYLLTKTKHKRLTISEKKFREYCIENNIDRSSIILTIEKCANYQLLDRYNETDVALEIDEDISWSSSANADTYEVYSISKPGNILYEYINELKIV